MGLFGQNEEGSDEDSNSLEGTSQGFTVDGLNFYQQQTNTRVEWPSGQGNDEEPQRPGGTGDQV